MDAFTHGGEAMIYVEMEDCINKEKFCSIETGSMKEKKSEWGMECQSEDDARSRY